MTGKFDKTKLQGWMAVASFSVGSLIAIGCIFFVEPLGHIENSAISIVSEFLILSGALLGIKNLYDLKFKKLEDKINELGKSE